MQSFPTPLSAKEEEHYLKLHEQGDKEARRILIERNLRLVAYLVKKYNSSDLPQEDLISIGTIGLINPAKVSALQPTPHAVSTMNFS